MVIINGYPLSTSAAVNIAESSIGLDRVEHVRPLQIQQHMLLGHPCIDSRTLTVLAFKAFFRGD
ncbi:hypothetical protein CRN79_15220 [Serratia fonticola]|nr:hypothetical protein CRN79_15220 [Serratia fonticola]